MINKVIKLRNIGRFVNYNHCGDLDLRKFNIVYSENARGKTTLCAVFRSIKTNRIEYIEGRRTLGSPSDPEIEILIDNRKYALKNKKWEPSAVPNIEIFDSYFVTRCVYSGNFIDNDHRKSLYLFVIGERGVELAENFYRIAEDITKINQEIKKTEASINKHILGNKTSIDSFVKLPRIDNIDSAINEQEAVIYSIKKSDEIIKKDSLSPVSIPPFPLSELTETLNLSLEQVLDNAEAKIKEYITEFLDEEGEKWLETGVQYIKGDKCPYCGQNTYNNDLIKAYKSYFSDEYRSLKTKIDEYSTSLKNLFSQQSLLSIQSTLSKNEQLIEFWNTHIDCIPPKFDFEILRTLWLEISEASITYINQKKYKPLETITIDNEIKDSIEKYQKLVSEIVEYNKSVEMYNAAISKKKQTISSDNIETATDILYKLKNTATRYLPDVDKLVADYNRLLEKKTILENRKIQCRKELDTYTFNTFTEYERLINKYLRNFGANFCVKKCKTSYIGGKPSTQFCLSINNVEIELGTSETPISKPSFQNTISEGDKNTLALAFFLSRLELDPKLQDKIIIFDDPISSLDNHRKSSTVSQILELSKKAKQIIIFTHDIYFAMDLYKDNHDNANMKALSIKRNGEQDSTICLWDIESETQSEYYQNYSILARYLEKGTSSDLWAVVRCIRPLLEDNLRLRFPMAFKVNENKWLGNYIEDIRNSKPGDHIYVLKPCLPELESINNYSKRYHHGNGNCTEIINESELNTFVKRTIKLLGGIHQS